MQAFCSVIDYIGLVIRIVIVSQSNMNPGRPVVDLTFIYDPPGVMGWGDLWCIYTLHLNRASNMFVSPNKICRVVEALLVPLSILMMYLVFWLAKFYMFLHLCMCHLHGTILVHALCQWERASGQQARLATTCRPPAFDRTYWPRAWDKLVQYLEKITR